MRTFPHMLCAGLFLAAVVPARADDRPFDVRETPHYRLVTAPEDPDAAEFAAVLEAAWDGFRTFFGCEPELGKGARLRVIVLPDRAAWEAAIRADGTEPPAGAGGYYWPGSRTAYLYRQPTRLFTRVLLVHEAAHQFHYLARTKNRSPGPGWYTEGIAEYLGWHEWDGERIRLGVAPLVSLEDYPAKALASARAEDFDLAAIVAGDVPASRPIAWALTSFLAARPKRSAFDAFCRRLEAGGAPVRTFARSFGRPSRLVEEFRSFVESAQQAFSPVFNEWEPLGDDAVGGRAGVVSVCRLVGAAHSLCAHVAPPPESGRHRVGVLLHFADAGDYTVALIDRSGRWHVDRRRDGSWHRLAAGDGLVPGPDGRWELTARRGGTQVVWLVGGREVVSLELPTGGLGLCLENTTARFEGLAWE